MELLYLLDEHDGLLNFFQNEYRSVIHLQEKGSANEMYTVKSGVKVNLKIKLR
jgi:hypothetical protein